MPRHPRVRFRKILERLTGMRIFTGLPRGVEVYSDIRSALPRYRVDVIFDVGANTGQSARAYRSAYPDSRIYCFEPVAASYDRLVEKAAGDSDIQCYRLALSSSPGRRLMRAKGTSTSNRLLEGNPNVAGEEVETQAVPVSTLDRFCQEHGIDRINYLKIDTEGNDLEVLAGAQQLLEAGRIDLVEVEAGLSPSNDRHVALEALKHFLEARDYCVFGIYKQARDFSSEGGGPAVKWPHVRRANTVFIARSLSAQYPRPVDGARHGSG